MSATTITAEPITTLRPQMPVVYDSSCRSLLTDDVRPAVESLVSLLTHAAARQHIPVLRLDVRGFTDPEEENAQIVVRQWVRLTPPEALHYWDSLGPSYEAWLRSCSDLMPDATEQVAFEVRWTEDDSTF